MRLTCVLILAWFSSALVTSGAVAQSDASALYQASEQSIFLIYLNDASGKPTAFGSGFVVGLHEIITNAHVVAGGKPVIAVGPVRIPATVVKIDEKIDLALLRVTVDLTSKPLVTSSKTVETGARVFVIGNPEGLEKTLSEGLVSGLRDFDGRKLLQITNPISPGSSGGPVLNQQGEVIGVTVLTFKEGQNLNFAVPGEVLRDFMASPSTNGNADSVPSSIDDLVAALEKRTEPYSEDATSQYQIKSQSITHMMQGVMLSNDPETLIELAHLAQGEDYDISLRAAQKSESLRPSTDAKLAIAEAHNFLALFKSGKDQLDEQAEALSYAQRAVKDTKLPSQDLLATLAWSVEQTGNNIGFC